MPVITDLSLTITPVAGLYTNVIQDTDLTFSENTSHGRNQIIINFANNEGVYDVDMGTIFQWPVNAGTILDVWQPSIIPLDEDLYSRMSYHFLMKSLGGVGWQHIREMNLAYQSTADITLNFQFDVTASPLSFNLTVPTSNSNVTKTKIIMPPNKWKMVELFVFSANPFLLWTNDMEFRVKSWGSAEPYRNLKPINA